MECTGNCHTCLRDGQTYRLIEWCELDVLSKFYKSKYDLHTKKKIVTDQIKDESSRVQLNDMIRSIFDEVWEQMDQLGNRLPQRNAEVLGDCLASLYLFMITRDRLITREDIRSVLPILRRASKRSIKASTVVYMVTGTGIDKLPICWLVKNGQAKHRSTDSSNRGTIKRKRRVVR